MAQNYFALPPPSSPPNWHQTVLSREEYFSAYPAEPVADADGWIEWGGGECPVDGDALVVCKVRTGKGWRNGRAIKAAILRWRHTGGMADIIAYRLQKPEVKSTAVGDDETNIAAKEELEELLGKVTDENKHTHVDANPTIEQLASDYRNANDYAERKQQEADDAKASADSAFGELVAAGKAIDLVIGIATPDPELVITDHRDLMLGDIIEYVDGDMKDKIGMTWPVVELDNMASDGMCVRLKCDNGVNTGRSGWPKKWRFIRRP